MGPYFGENESRIPKEKLNFFHYLTLDPACFLCQSRRSLALKSHALKSLIVAGKPNPPSHKSFRQDYNTTNCLQSSLTSHSRFPPIFLLGYTTTNGLDQTKGKEQKYVFLCGEPFQWCCLTLIITIWVSVAKTSPSRGLTLMECDRPKGLHRCLFHWLRLPLPRSILDQFQTLSSVLVRQTMGPSLETPEVII